MTAKTQTLIKTKKLRFNGTEIVFVKSNNDTTNSWLIPAKLVGLAMGYANGGQKLSDLITNSWKKEWTNGTDYRVISDTALAALKKETPQYGVSLTANSVLFLTVSGVVRVLTRSRSKTAQGFREFLAKNGGELVAGQPLLTEKTTVQPVQTELPFETSAPALEEFRKTLLFGKKMGLYTKDELKVLTTKLMDVQLTGIAKAQGVTNFLKPDGTITPPTVGLNKTTLSVPEGNFSLITKANPQHPKYADWLTAADIGRPLGMRADFVKKYLKKYVEGFNEDLPNNDAKKFVELNNGKFPDLDEDGYIVFKPRSKVQGVAMLAKMDGNALNWRNYWHPSVVLAVRQQIATEKKIKLPNALPANGTPPMETFINPDINFTSDEKITNS